MLLETAHRLKACATFRMLTLRKNPPMIETKIESSLQSDAKPQETSEWIEALDEIIDESGTERANFLIEKLLNRTAEFGAVAPGKINTPYCNTIPVDQEAPYPGDRAIERTIKSLIRWNAMAMVVRANKYDPGIGGHISTYASLATLSEVGHNHFFHARYD